MGLGGMGGQFSGQHQHLHRNITKIIILAKNIV
jgi:hypothetical protein